MRLSHEILMFQLAHFLMDATLAVDSGDLDAENLPTAPEIARHLGLDTELVKKKLKVLKEEGLLQATSMSPKRYRFDYYQFKKLPEDSELYAILHAKEPA